MKYSKKYLKKIKKRILNCIFSITMILMLIAGGRLADISVPINKAKLKNLSTRMETEENKTTLINQEDNQNSTYSEKELSDTSEVKLSIRQEYIKIGETLDIDVVGEVATSAQEGYTWTTSNEDVATVDSNGIVIGRGMGRTTITAYNPENGLKAKAIINVYRNTEGAVTVPQVALGEGFTIVLKEDGTVWSTGTNDSGQLGDGTTTNRNKLAQVKIDENTYLTNIKKVVLGHSHALALTLDGEIYGWGWNSNGILGQGDTKNKVYAEKVKGEEGVGYLKNIIDISTGYASTLATDKYGKLYGWSLSGNEYGLMGIENYNYVPVELKQIRNVIDVDIGFSDGAAMLANGETWVWGYNNNGSVGNGSTGRAEERILGTDINEIKFDGYSGYYIKEEKTLWASGRNHCGQLGIGDTQDRSIFTQVKLSDETPVMAKIVEAGVGNATFIGTDGKAYAMGYNGYGQLCDGTTQDATYPIVLKNSDGTEVTDAICIVSGTNRWNTLSRNIALIRKDGSICLSGDNTYGQIGNETNESTKYLTPMSLTTMPYLEKIDMQVGETRTLTEQELTIIKEYVNVFGKGKEENTLVEKAEILNTNIATYENGTIEAKVTGETTLKLESDEGIVLNIPVTVVSDDAAIELVEVNDILRNPTKEDKNIYEAGISKLSETAKIRVKARSKYGIVKIGENAGTASEQTVTVNLSLSEERITIPVEITASDGVTVKAYSITLIRQSNETGLDKVIVNSVEIENKNNVYLYYLEQEEKDANIKIIAKDNNANIVVGDQSGIGNLEFDEHLGEDTKRITKTIKVVAEDGRTAEYTLIISRKNEITGEAIPKIVGGSQHYIALKANGSVWGWGLNEDGQLGIGNNLNQLEPVKAKAELDDGTIEEITDAIDVAAGTYHTLVLRKDGTVWATGDNEKGQLGDGTDSKSNMFHKVKLNNEGDYLENIESISAGGRTSYALTKDGEVYGWGWDYYGQLGINGRYGNEVYPIKIPNVSNIVQISAGNMYVIMLDLNGSVWGIGENESGQLGLGYAVGYIGTAKQMKTEDGTEILYGVKEISAGDYHAVILKEDGTVWSTGKNDYGQLGVGSNVVNANLYQVRIKEAEDEREAEYVTGVKHIQAGGDVTYISRQKTKEGKNAGMYVMGYNRNGGLFTQDTEDKNIAIPVEGDKDIITMAPLKESNGWIGQSLGGAIVDQYGKVYTVGENTYGQLGNGTFDKSIIPICIDGTRMEVMPEEITYKNIGENTKRITCKMTVGFNLLMDEEKERKYTFTSNNEKIATVDQTGKVTAIGEGTTTITVREVDTGTEKEIPVNVIVEKIQQIIGQITTENLEGKYTATVKLYKKRRKEDGNGYEEEDTLITEKETTEDGKYVLDIDEIGIYDVLITKAGYLNYKIAEIEIKEGAIVEIQEYALIAGDVAVDGEIEIDDLVDMNRNIGKEITEENKEEKAIYDLNEDGIIDMEDRKILKKNYGKKAEEEKWIDKSAEIALMSLDIIENTNTNAVVAPFVGIPVRDDTTVPDETVFILPMTCKYTITSTYGKRVHPITGEEKVHHGIDLVGVHHTEILSVADGTVMYAGTQNGYGNCIEIKHIVDGETIYSFYAHLSEIKIKAGEKVKKGQVIGLEGGAETDEGHGTSTGHHLHFEIRTASGSGHSIDPRTYINF